MEKMVTYWSSTAKYYFKFTDLHEQLDIKVKKKKNRERRFSHDQRNAHQTSTRKEINGTVTALTSNGTFGTPPLYQPGTCWLI
jgi:hypothetical protein